MAGDISKFLNSNEVRVISDVEGASLYNYITKFNEQGQRYNGNIIITGDIIDSTSPPGNPPAFESLSFNIRNLISCYRNPKIIYVLGNRDINKIKVYHLTTLKIVQTLNKQQKIIINEFNNGFINSMGRLQIVYQNLKSLFENNMIVYNSKMNNWYTFWSPGLGSERARKWQDDVEYNFTPFYKRFLDIFGADNAIGTMSAGNLLQTIPTELGINGDDDYKAFIVLYVFRIMLMKSTTLPNYIYNNLFSLRGLLYNFYMKGNGILYGFTKDRKLLVFSHGGIPSYFSESYFRMLEQKIRMPNFYKYVSDAKEALQLGPQSGGFITNSQQLITNINSFNLLFKKHIMNVLNEIITPKINKPTYSMLFLLIVSSPFDCNNFSRLIRKSVDCMSLQPSSTIGPIVSGIRELYKYPLSLIDIDLIQIFGHVPIGIGASIFEFSEKRSNKSTLINLDTSNTFKHLPDNINLAKTMLTYDNGLISIYSYLNLNIQSLAGKLISEGSLPVTITINQNLNDITQIQKYTRSVLLDASRDNRLFFHGIGVDSNNNNFALFTLNQNLYGKGGFNSKYFVIPVTNKNWYSYITRNAQF
jgi:hypothetical protein